MAIASLAMAVDPVALTPVAGDNRAECTMAVGASTRVTADGHPVLTIGSLIPVSLGPAAIPAMPNGECRFFSGSSKVTAGGLPIVRSSDPTNQNGSIWPGSFTVPSQTKVEVG